MDPVEIEVFATGEHTSRQGVTKVWTRDELDALATEYNTQYPDRKAPAIIEHPVEGKPTPAMGWATEFTVKDRTDRKGNAISVLVAKMVDFQPQFVDWVKRGLFRERSLGMRNGKIHHIAWLGGKLPAVAGLEPFNFSTADDDQDEYWAEAPSQNQSFSMTPEEIQALADAITKGVTDALTPKFDEITKAITDAGGGAGSGAGDGTGDGTGGGAGASDNSKSDAETVVLRQQVVTLTEQRQEDQFSMFLDSDEVKGRFTPAERPALMRQMKVLANAGEYEFSEATANGGSENKKRSHLDDFKESLKARPKLTTLQEFATDGAGSTSDDEFEKRRKSAATANARASKKKATT